MAPSYGKQGMAPATRQPWEATVGAGRARDSSLVGGMAPSHRRGRVGGMAPSYGKRGHGPLLQRNERGEKT